MLICNSTVPLNALFECVLFKIENIEIYAPATTGKVTNTKFKLKPFKVISFSQYRDVLVGDMQQCKYEIFN